MSEFDFGDIGSDLRAAWRAGALAVARFGDGLIVLMKHDAATVYGLPFDELDHWRMYYERLMLDCMEHVALFDAELKRRAPPVESLVGAMRAGERDADRDRQK